jgi:uncharacterized protein (DUF488 family)
MKIVTIGVYGFKEEAFFEALQTAGVGALCDIRRRRGVRGATYAFANSRRLQRRLAELNIQYLHRLDLAPTKTIRERQAAADAAGKVAKRKRTTLSPAFVAAYQDEVLTHFEPRSLLAELTPGVRTVALFCVEREPEACHRSLVAGMLEREPGFEVEHLMP